LCPGVILAEIRRRYPDKALHGVDLSESRLLDARRSFKDRRRVSVHRASATALPFKSDSFDLIYSRFLLQYLADRGGAVREMVRVCRPGGTVLLQDLDGQLVWHHPVDLTMQSQLSQVMTYLAPTGFDPFVGRKLFQLARDADLQHLTVEVEPYHLVAGECSPREIMRWRSKLNIARPTIAQALGEHVASEAIARFIDYLRRPDTLSYSIMFTVRGRKKREENLRRG
jgi:SAM-dependent methyltransferase